jgi:hypothetical protein
LFEFAHEGQELRIVSQTSLMLGMNGVAVNEDGGDLRKYR